MKFLCVCNHGRVRSKALASALNQNYHDAIARGITLNQASNSDFEWADKIIMLSELPNAVESIPPTYSSKVVNAVMEADRWFDNTHFELISIVEAIVRKNGWWQK